MMYSSASTRGLTSFEASGMRMSAYMSARLIEASLAHVWVTAPTIQAGSRIHLPKSKYWEREQQKKQGSCSTQISDPDFLPSLALVMLSAWNASQRLLTVTTSAGWAGKSLSSWKMSRQLLQTVGMPKLEDTRIVPLPVTYRATRRSKGRAS